LKKHLFLIKICIILFSFNTVLAQTPKKIIIEHSDFADINQLQIPDAALLTGNVRVNHDGAILTCNKAYWFQKENYIKAFGNVQIIQGDTLTMTSKYAEYNGNIKQAYATGDVVLKSPDMSLVTDTLNFNRNSQEAFYSTGGLITNKGNTGIRTFWDHQQSTEKTIKFILKMVFTTPKKT
jgi:lipopolysaccharide assembly outer membrane protein LptD (OstA)